MDEKERKDVELRERALELAIANCAHDECYETTGDLVGAAQDIFGYLKKGEIPKKEVKKSGR